MFIEGANRSQSTLFPECLEDAPVRVIDVFVYELDLEDGDRPGGSTPKDVVGKLNEATHAAMDTPAVKIRLNEVGIIGMPPERRGPEYLAKYVVEEIARWEGPIKASGLQVD